MGNQEALPLFSQVAGSLTIYFAGKFIPCDDCCYCWRGPLEASSRSRICSNVTASISPRAYL